MQALLQLCLRGRGCRVVRTRGKGRTLRLLGGRRISLYLLSVVVPRVSKCRILRRLHGADGVPIVVLSTGSTSSRGVLKLGLKTSSCLTGPFGPLRTMTHIGSGVHQFCTLKATRLSSGVLAIQSLRLSPRNYMLGGGKRPVRLASMRCQVVRLFVGRPKGIFAGRRVCRRK